MQQVTKNVQDTEVMLVAIRYISCKLSIYMYFTIEFVSEKEFLTAEASDQMERFFLFDKSNGPRHSIVASNDNWYS